MIRQCGAVASTARSTLHHQGPSHEHPPRKVAVVTGASQGIGAALVKAYRDIGYAVVATSRSIQPSSDEGVLAVAGDIGDRALAAEPV